MMVMAARDPAPGRLQLVEDFINTLEVDTGTDELADDASAGAWLISAGLLGAGSTVTAVEAAVARALREALRHVVWANNGAPIPGSALADLNHLASDLPVTVSFTGTAASALVPVAAGLEAALATLLGIVHTAMADGTWDRLKACRDDTCRWVYYDHSRNRSAAWCSMAVCGNRAKARAFRSRSRTSA
jgi:predicted RNA-binding Zn ribbon-like protein